MVCFQTMISIAWWLAQRHPVATAPSVFFAGPVMNPCTFRLPGSTAPFSAENRSARAALTRAVQYINAVDSALRVEQVPQGSPADIRIHFVDTDGKAPLQNTGIEGADGTIVTGARVIVWSDRATGTIKRATILFGTRLHIRDYESAMLEELTQALGLLTDIRNPAYNDVSIFSQDSNASKQFGPQDRMVLRRHYPKE